VLQWNTFLGGSGLIGATPSRWMATAIFTWQAKAALPGVHLRAPTSAGTGADAYAAKLNSSGALQWNTFLGGSGDDYGNAIAVDGSGNVYVAGTSDVTWVRLCAS